MLTVQSKGFSQVGMIFLVLGILGIGAGALMTFQYGLTALNPASTEKFIFEVKKGESPQSILIRMKEAGLIERPKIIYWVGRAIGKWSKIKVGEYLVSPSMSPLSILSVFESGVSVGHVFTLKEGQNIYEIAQDLESKSLMDAQTFLSLVRNPDWIRSLKIENQSLDGTLTTLVTLEGYLFPETYSFPKSMAAEDMIELMIKQFQSRWTSEMTKRAQELGMTRHQVITLASVVEKETAAPEERPLISSVFHNRIKKKMRLQSDPTTIYGIWERYQENHKNLRRSDLLEQTPFNTYAVNGLPAGPIANPGLEAIQATLNPATSPYLFFVSKNNGTHQFSESLEAHNAAVRELQIDPKAREGKSWRDLKRKTIKPK